MTTPDSEHLDWDVDRDGRMAEYASDDEPQTIPYEGEDDA